VALSKKTINKHNIKRAEVFKANGLCDMDVAFAHPAFVGYATDSQDCCLCGHRHIKWLFAIRFAVPDLTTMLGKISTGITRTEEVILKHVGSKCITDWLDAIPESEEKLEALKRWKYELDKCNAAKTAKVVEDLCAKAGYETPEAAYEAFAALNLSYSSPVRKALGWKAFSQLRNNAKKIKWKRSSRSTVKTWLENLAKALALTAPKQPEPEPEPKAGGQLDFPFGANVKKEAGPKTYPDTVQGWADRAEAILNDPGKLGKLSTYGQNALRSIRKKTLYYGSFATDKQKNFYIELIKEAEASEEEKAAANEVAPKVKPGDADYVSPSGIAGARY
jgi:hypothetical protein